METQLQQEILVRIDALAEKLEVAAGALWEVTVREVYVSHITWLVLTLLTIVASGVGFMYTAVKFSECEDASTKEGWLAIGAALGVVLVVSTLVLLFGGSTMATNILVPEAQAFRNILEAIK